MENKFDIPILLLVFRRPEVTNKLWAEIKKIKPAKLYIGCDGPRKNIAGEAEKVLEVKNIFKDINWDCEVKTYFQEENKGSRVAESLAMNWFFDNVDEGIILEDDCIPAPDLFKYCQEMLEYYRYDERIMIISGSNFQFGNVRGEGSYYFSKFPNTWGWATWKRAWKSYDVDLKDFPQFKKSKIISLVTENKTAQTYFLDHLKAVYEKKIDAWDAQILFMLWANNGLGVVPNTNLVTNIGVGEGSVNTLGNISNINFLPIGEIGFPLKHPKVMIPDLVADEFIMKVFKINTINILRNKFKIFVVKILKRLNVYKLYKALKDL